MRHTHSELTDPNIRAILANELLVLRRSMRQIKSSMNDDFTYGIRTGLDTFARRLQDVNERGLKAVYWQNYNV
jgi:hypothetical protein